MIICGLKLTHDGTVALVDNERLIFSIEMEKLDNNARYGPVEDLSIVTRLLNDFGYSPDDVDYFVIDGWGGADLGSVQISNGDRDIYLAVAGYREKKLKDSVFEQYKDTGLLLNGKKYSYISFTHAAGHIASAWFTSPFARLNESSFILVWDGAMTPRLYFLDAKKRSIKNIGEIFSLYGNIYPVFAQHFGPFKREESLICDDLSVSGKVMAYIALGSIQEKLLQLYSGVYKKKSDLTMDYTYTFAQEVGALVKGKGYSDEDILASFHEFLKELLIKSLKEKMLTINGNPSGNLCYAGGCALNIKWNTAIRDSGLFDKIWVPPFPNDTGSAIGTACSLMMEDLNFRYLDWNVYAGMPILPSEADSGWNKKPCSIPQLARLLHTSGEPVIFLTGCAELGPRALGNRSILAAASSSLMRDILNEAKGRENYRPVAPICLEEKASMIFKPDIPDPYMLFEHQVRNKWKERVPAIVHIDGTARLQTVNKQQNMKIAELLLEYETLSGIPLLCNTSANFKECGFFPDVRSATRWGKINYIWTENTLYEKTNKVRSRFEHGSVRLK